LGAGALGGATAFAGGTLGKKLGLADIDTALVQGSLGNAKHGLARRVAGGALTEGALEELPQSMQEQMWENYALDRPLMDNVGKAGAQGLLTGAAMGAGANVLARRAPQNPQADSVPEAGNAEPLGLPAPEQGLPPYDPFVDNPIPPAPPAGPLQRAANILTENLPQVVPSQSAPQAALGFDEGLLGEVLPAQSGLNQDRASLGADPLIIEGEFSEIPTAANPQNPQGQPAVPALEFEGETVYPSYPAARRAAREQGLSDTHEAVKVAPKTFALREKAPAASQRVEQKALPAPQGAQEAQTQEQGSPAAIESYRQTQAQLAEQAGRGQQVQQDATPATRKAVQDAVERLDNADNRVKALLREEGRVENPKEWRQVQARLEQAKAARDKASAELDEMLGRFSAAA